MSVGFVAPLAAAILVLALAVVFARLWVNDACSRSPRDHPLGSRAGRSGRVGEAWAFRAAHERGNVVIILAVLAIAAWIAVVTSLDAAR
jgi:hypothetical protein